MRFSGNHVYVLNPHTVPYGTGKLQWDNIWLGERGNKETIYFHGERNRSIKYIIIQQTLTTIEWNRNFCTYTPQGTSCSNEQGRIDERI